jgi:hypothetical protein
MQKGKRYEARSPLISGLEYALLLLSCSFRFGRFHFPYEPFGGHFSLFPAATSRELDLELTNDLFDVFEHDRWILPG